MCKRSESRVRWLAWSAAACLLLAASAGAQPFQYYREARAYAHLPDLLVEQRGQAAFEPLVAMLAERKSSYGVIAAIAATRHPQVKAFLLAKLKDPGTLDTTQQRRIREEAIEALLVYGQDAEVARGIAALLLDDKAGRFPQEEAAEALVGLAHPGDDAAGQVRQALGVGLAALGGHLQHLQHQVALLVDHRQLVFDFMGGAGGHRAEEVQRPALLLPSRRLRHRNSS